jgi:hypothetical protein
VGQKRRKKMRDRGEKEKITGRKKGASAQGRRKNYSSVA